MSCYMMEPYISERGGKQYMYRATSRYSAEKKGPVAETEYMGRVVDGKLQPKRGYFYNEETGEFGRIDDTMAGAREARTKGHDVVIRTSIFGDVYFLMALQERLDIRTDLRASFGPEIGDTVLAVAMAYTISPRALMHMGDIIDRRCIKRMLGLPADMDFSSPRMTELTQEIGSMDGAMEEFFARRLDAEDGLLVYDLTSESTYSVKNSFGERGRNKDHVPAAQVNLGLVTNKKGAPLMFRLFPGSMADVVTLRRLVEDVKRLKEKGDATMVMDRGFVSVKSVYYLLENGMDFVAPMALNESGVVKNIVTGLISRLTDVKHRLVHSGTSYTMVRSHLGVRKCKGANMEKRSTVWEDPDGYELVLEDDDTYANCEHYLDVFAFHDRVSAAQEINGMDLALEGIISDLEGTRPRNPAKSFQRKAGSYANLLDWDMTDKGLHVFIKQNAHTFAANRKGVFIMIAPTDGERTAANILDSYAVRGVIEDVFMEDKNEGDGRTPRSGDRDTIEGRTLIRMVSMIMKVEMLCRISEVADDKTVKSENKPRNIGRRTPESLLASLSNIEMVEGDGWSHLTEVTRDNRLVYNMFDIGPTKGLIEYRCRRAPPGAPSV